jgi:hypothetical protein
MLAALAPGSFRVGVNGAAGVVDTGRVVPFGYYRMSILYLIFLKLSSLVGEKLNY